MARNLVALTAALKGNEMAGMWDTPMGIRWVAQMGLILVANLEKGSAAK